PVGKDVLGVLLDAVAEVTCSLTQEHGIFFLEPAIGPVLVDLDEVVILTQHREDWVGDAANVDNLVFVIGIADLDIGLPGHDFLADPAVGRRAPQGYGCDDCQGDDMRTKMNLHGDTPAGWKFLLTFYWR